MTFGPQNLKEAKTYRYGKWAGNPKGMGHQPGDCIEEVFDGFHSHQCSKRATRGPEAAWCGTHNPERLAKRLAGRELADAERQQCDQKIENRGETLIKRIGGGTIAFSIKDFRPQEALVLPFDLVERLLGDKP